MIPDFAEICKEPLFDFLEKQKKPAIPPVFQAPIFYQMDCASTSAIVPGRPRIPLVPKVNQFRDTCRPANRPSKTTASKEPQPQPAVESSADNGYFVLNAMISIIRPTRAAMTTKTICSISTLFPSVFLPLV